MNVEDVGGCSQWRGEFEVVDDGGLDAGGDGDGFAAASFAGDAPDDFGDAGGTGAGDDGPDGHGAAAPGGAGQAVNQGDCLVRHRAHGLDHGFGAGFEVGQAVDFPALIHEFGQDKAGEAGRAAQAGDLLAEAFGLDPAGGGGEVVERVKGLAGDRFLEAGCEAGLIEGQVRGPAALGQEPGIGGLPVLGQAPDAEFGEGNGAVGRRLGVGAFPQVGRARGEPVDECAELPRAMRVGGVGVHVGQIGVQVEGAEHGGVVDDETGGVGLAGDRDPAAEALAMVGLGGDVEAPAFVDDGAGNERGVVGVADG